MKLSIITVCKNTDKVIEKTIISVIKQTFIDYEYIVIDGASSDGTLDLINKYSTDINKLISEPDKGIYDAMNKGIEQSTGEYLMFLNAGDYFVNSDVLQKVFKLNFYEDIVYGDTLILHRSKFIRKPASSRITKFFMFFDTIPHQNVFIRKSVFEKAGMHDVNYRIAGDYDFFLRAIFKYGIKTQYFGFPVTVNNLEGVSADRKNKKITYDERRIAQNKWFNKNISFCFRLLKPFVYVFHKYPKYIINIFCSLTCKNYLRI